MKKSYVKPVMESEAFVANEYVGVCYYVKCSDHSEGEVKKLDHAPTYNISDSDNDGFVFSVYQPNRFYSGTINGQNGTVRYASGCYGHPIENDPVLINKDNHQEYNCGPNAS